ncbi:rubrerythrin family protein [Clostridium formicaceticum]|uniref:Rubrerythrin-2 n=1 Tax=Clostridium formicaceticum TaxID=1497 RepID=A0AAC9RQA7_9CLOT|nr:rubrerythrin family protein [Clostridium formicaceticum]AOY74861.1 Rubrerythrin-2 [Clostridium formicaceticum]ARE89260.1 Rubrerythrin-2 [Clostridium formicaceticum]
MNEMTSTNLKSAFGGESMAHMRYLQWSAAAKKEGFPNVANLFTAVAYAEQVHAANHFRELKNEVGDAAVTAGAGFGMTNTSENLQGAIDGENHEVEQMYPAFIAVAELQAEKGSIRSFQFALEAEKTHAVLFANAKTAVDAGKDFAENTVHVCNVCGYTLTGALESDCPVCKVKTDKFTTFSTEASCCSCC